MVAIKTLTLGELFRFASDDGSLSEKSYVYAGTFVDSDGIEKSSFCWDHFAYWELWKRNPRSHTHLATADVVSEGRFCNHDTWKAFH